MITGKVIDPSERPMRSCIRAGPLFQNSPPRLGTFELNANCYPLCRRTTRFSGPRNRSALGSPELVLDSGRMPLSRG